MTRKIKYDRDVALDSAVMLFWEKGYHATSLKNLEAALHMKPGSIYAAFSSKTNLYLLAMERYFEASKADFISQIQAASSPLQSLADHLRSYAELPSDHPQAKACMLMKTLVDTRSTDTRISNQARRYILDIQKEIARVFELAKTAGEIPQDSDVGRLSRRYQALITALRFELHKKTLRAHVKALAEDFAGGIEQLRLSAKSVQPNSTNV